MRRRVRRYVERPRELWAMRQGVRRRRNMLGRRMRHDLRRAHELLRKLRRYLEQPGQLRRLREGLRRPRERRRYLREQPVRHPVRIGLREVQRGLHSHRRRRVQLRLVRSCLQSAGGWGCDVCGWPMRLHVPARNGRLRGHVRQSRDRPESLWSLSHSVRHGRSVFGGHLQGRRVHGWWAYRLQRLMRRPHERSESLRHVHQGLSGSGRRRRDVRGVHLWLYVRVAAHPVPERLRGRRDGPGQLRRVRRHVPAGAPRDVDVHRARLRRRVPGGLREVRLGVREYVDRRQQLRRLRHQVPERQALQCGDLRACVPARHAHVQHEQVAAASYWHAL